MLEIVVKAKELFDDEKQEFITLKKDTVLKLEHSLVSISKWESKWHRCFLDDGPKTIEEQLDYIKDMCYTSSSVDDEVFNALSEENLKAINEYISNQMTATRITSNRQGPKRYGPQDNHGLTSEVIYYLMIQYGIPFDCQKWHINRLLTLLRVCEIKEAPAKKMSMREVMAQNRAINEARKAKYHTRG